MDDTADIVALSRTDSLLLAINILSAVIKRKSQNGGSGLRICRAIFDTSW
jgi:hypothetical protein